MKNAFIQVSMCVGLFITACSDKKDNSNEEKFPVTNPVAMDTVYTTEYVADIHSRQNVEIRARVKGYIEAILVDEGKHVQAGQVLFSISDREYKEALIRAKASLKSAIAEAKSEEVNLQNVKILVEKNIVSKTELELAQSKLDAANAKIEEAKSDEANAALKLSFTEIKAPFDGIINRILNKTGSLIDEGTLLTTLSDNTEVFAYFNISEKEYLGMLKDKSKKQNDVRLILADGQLFPYPGKIETVESEIDKSTGNLAFRARFNNPEQLLKHGSSGKIQLINKLSNATIIPQKATFEIQEKTYVFVVDKNNTVQSRSIAIKQRLPHLYVIESGLSPKDRIIYEGIQSVKEGDKITPKIISMIQIIAQQAKL